MAAIEIAELTSPISESDPCGPDLEVTGDPEFMNFMARAEGLLPTSFFSGPEGKPLERSPIDVQAEFTSAQPYLAKTHDIRLLVLLAKFCLIDRDLDGFIQLVNAIAMLLDGQWDNVHPRGEDGDFSIRLAVLDTLDDMVPVIFPLQYIPLMENRRLGAISYRHFMFAAGQAEPREGEESHDTATLEKASAETDLAKLVERRQQFERLQTALAAIKKAFDTRLQPGAGVDFKKLSDLTANIFALLNGLIIKLDPSAGKAVPDPLHLNEPTAKPAEPGRIKSSQDAAAALAAVADYFSRCEPSNPALLLARQAVQLMGKSLPEIVQILMPAQFEQAKFLIDKSQSFEIPIGRLAQFDLTQRDASTLDGNPEADGRADADPRVADDASGAAAAAEHSQTAGGLNEKLGEGQDQIQTRETGNVGASVATRREALVLLEEIAGYYRAAEPSSPIALITERARGLADRDFLSLLRELLPQSGT